MTSSAFQPGFVCASTRFPLERLKQVGSVIPSNVDKHSRDTEFPVSLANYTDVYKNASITTRLDLMQATASASQIRRLGLRAGDTLITKDSETADDIGVPAYVPFPMPGVVCGYHLAIIRPGPRMVPRFVYWLFHSEPLRSYFEVAAKGLTRVGLTGESIGSALLPVPALDEQRRIAAFLDYETARIDELAQQQERLRSLLLEKRLTVVSEAVTTGFSMSPTRSSGCWWLGAINHAWDIPKLSHVARIRSGLVDPTQDPYIDYTLIAPNHLESGTGRIVAQASAREQGAESGKYLSKPGDIIYSKIRPSLVKACENPGRPVLCSADMYSFAPAADLESGFLLLYLLSEQFTRFATAASDRVAMPKVNQEALSECRMPLPDPATQKCIVQEASVRLAEIDRLLNESMRLADIAAERRSALITAAVTGQIDVSSWRPPDDWLVPEPA